MTTVEFEEPKPIERVIVLRISEEVAKTIMELVGSTISKGQYRKHCDDVYDALYGLGLDVTANSRVVKNIVLKEN